MEGEEEHLKYLRKKNASAGVKVEALYANAHTRHAFWVHLPHHVLEAHKCRMKAEDPGSPGFPAGNKYWHSHCNRMVKLLSRSFHKRGGKC